MLLASFCSVGLLAQSRPIPEEDKAPIFYSTTETTDATAVIQKKLDAGELRLEWDDTRGYLPSVLKLFNIDPASQTLVFSKTSLQQRQISPSRPRAVYFNDDVYIGWVQSGEVMEISAMDPQLGTTYYTLDQRPTRRPKFERQTDSCRVCHSGSMADNIPGLFVRSVFTNRVGEGFLRKRSYISDHTSPLSQRFGGWYVTGTSGRQQHMGNLTVGSESAIETVDLAPGTNVTDLSKTFDVGAYLTPTSDIVALMTLEHQARGHNMLTRANWHTRQAIARGEATPEAIKAAVEPLVQYVFFSKETRLTAPIAGTNAFAANFTARGPFDPAGRTLREFDMKTRMMKYPLSWLIYGEAFDALPEPAMRYFKTRLREILLDPAPQPDRIGLTPDIRQAIVDILRATKPSLADALDR